MNCVGSNSCHKSCYRINIKKAGILIKPMLNGRFAFKKDPEIKKPIAPNIEITNPTDAALPIALLIGYPKIS